MPFKLLFPYWMILVLVMVSCMVVFSDLWWDEFISWECSPEYYRQGETQETNWLHWLWVGVNNSNVDSSLVWSVTFSKGLNLVSSASWLSWKQTQLGKVHDSSEVFSLMSDKLWDKWWMS